MRRLRELWRRPKVAEIAPEPGVDPSAVAAVDAEMVAELGRWLVDKGGRVEPGTLEDHVLERYGRRHPLPAVIARLARDGLAVVEEETSMILSVER